jgi:hypothetical protein
VHYRAPWGTRGTTPHHTIHSSVVWCRGSHHTTPTIETTANQALTNAGNLVDLLQEPDLTARNFSIEKLSGYT